MHTTNLWSEITDTQCESVSGGILDYFNPVPFGGIVGTVSSLPLYSENVIGTTTIGYIANLPSDNGGTGISDLQAGSVQTPLGVLNTISYPQFPALVQFN